MSESSSGSDYGDQYQLATFVRRVVSVTDETIRRRQVRRHLTSVDAETVSEHLQQVIGLAVRGTPTAQEVYRAFICLCVSADERESLALEAIDLAARRADRHGVSWILLNPPPAKSARRTETMRRYEGPTLGHRRALAGRWNEAVIERLLLDDSPLVIARLCENPRLRESQVLSIVTRRPTSPAILTTVARSNRWLARTEVRFAIAQNPYVSTGLALLMIPSLPLNYVQRLRAARDLHEAIPRAAEYFIALREGTPDGPLPLDDWGTD